MAMPLPLGRASLLSLLSASTAGLLQALSHSERCSQQQLQPPSLPHTAGEGISAS